MTASLIYSEISHAKHTQIILDDTKILLHNVILVWPMCVFACYNIQKNSIFSEVLAVTCV